MVTNKALPYGKLGREQLRAIFALRTRQWPDGTPITLFVLPDQDPVHRVFATEVLNVFPYVLRETWDKKTFTGVARPPVSVSTQEELLERVAETRGGLGYVAGNPRKNHEGVKYVDIE